MDQSAHEEIDGNGKKAALNAEGITSRYGRRIKRIERQ